MNTRNVERTDRKSSYSIYINLDGIVIGDKPSSGLGKLMEATIGRRPIIGETLDSYLDSYHALEDRFLVPLLVERFETLRAHYGAISDDSEVKALQGEYTLADGKERHIHFSLHRTNPNGADLIELIIRDDTQTKKAHEKERKLKEGYVSLLHYIMHDVRGILGNASNFLTLMSRTSEPQKQQTYFERIRHNIESGIIFLTGNLINSKTGEFSILKEPYDLSQMIKEAYSLIETQYDGRRIRFELPEQAPIQTDKKITMALMEVMKNAAKYSKPDSEVLCTCRILEGNTNNCQEEMYETIIRNEGEMPEDTLRNMFRPGYKGTKSGDGFGLGLANVRNIIVPSGGEVYAQKVNAAGINYVQVIVRLPKN